MKTYNSMYLGLCVNNDDPQKRGRVQIFIPHIMPALYESWNKEGNDVEISCVGNNIEGALSPELLIKLKQILPWAEAASPIIGTSAPGNLVTSGSNGGESTSFYDTSPVSSPPTEDYSNTGVSLWNGGPSNFNTNGANMDGLNSEFRKRLEGMAAEFKQVTGQTMNISGPASAHRTYEQQVSLSNNSSVKAAKPGTSNHGFGFAVDISRSQIILADNKGLLAKYGLHRPMANDPMETQHVEPIGLNKDMLAPLKARRESGKYTGDQLAAALPSSGNGQATSLSDQTAAAANPHQAPDGSPTVTKDGSPLYGINADPTTGQAVSQGSTTNSTLASDRSKRFSQEIGSNQNNFLAKLEYVVSKEVGADSPVTSKQAMIETMFNRAQFSNKSLSETIGSKSYYAGNTGGTKTPSQSTIVALQRVMNGSNITNLATDAGYNKPGSTPSANTNFMTKKISEGVAKGFTSIIDNQTGMVVTDQNLINKLVNQGDATGRYEFYNRQNRENFNISDIEKYAAANGIEQTAPDLTAEALGINTSLVNNTSPNGPISQVNINNMAKGLFSYPAAGAMLWVFFREGNPLYPVYFAVSYSAAEWSSAYRTASPGIGYNPDPQDETPQSTGGVLNLNGVGGLHWGNTSDKQNSLNDQKNFTLFGEDGSNISFSTGLTQIYSKFDQKDQTDGDRWSTTLGQKEEWIQGDSNLVCMGDLIVKIGNVSQPAVDAVTRIQQLIKEIQEPLTK